MTLGQAVLLAAALATTGVGILTAAWAWRAAHWLKAEERVQAFVDEARAWNARATADVRPAAKVR